MSDESDYEAERLADLEQEYGALYHQLAGHYLHCTTIGAAREILDSGAIKPNTGDRAFTFRQTANSYGYLHGLVSLFDFASPPRERGIRMAERWHKFFPLPQGTTVAFDIDREWLSGRIIPNSDGACVWSPIHPRGYCIWIPHVEVWVNEPIPRTALLGAFIVESKDRLHYVRGPLTRVHV